MATHPSILAWKIHGQRSLVSCSPRGCKQSDTTEHLSTHTIDIYLREVLMYVCYRIAEKKGVH